LGKFRTSPNSTKLSPKKQFGLYDVTMYYIYLSNLYSTPLQSEEILPVGSTWVVFFPAQAVREIHVTDGSEEPEAGMVGIAMDFHGKTPWKTG
jgi:hypothetical protein